MTERDLVQALITYDTEEMASALTGLSDAGRKARYAHFKHFEKAGFKKGHIPTYYEWSVYPAEYLTPAYQWLAPQFEEATPVVRFKVGLLRLALGTLADAKRVEMDNNDDYWAAMVRVLDDRRPAWAGQWVENWLARESWWDFACWPVVRELIVRGVCAKPALDNYYHLLGRGLTWDQWKTPFAEGWQGDTYRTSDYLRDNPDLLEDVYGVLRVGSYALADSDDPWAETDFTGDEPLAHALRALTEEGLLDRNRLLGASLDGLNGGHAAQIQSRLSNFHEGMKPTKPEVTALQNRYLALLAAESDRIVAFGVKMLKKVEQAKTLDDAAYVDAAIPLLERKGKGMVKTVLDQFQKIGKRTPTLLGSILDAVATRGLIHPDTDIQDASLKLLEAREDAIDAPTRETIAGYVDEVAATLRDRARALAGSAAATPAPASEPSLKAPSTSELPEAWRAMAGVDEAQSALAAGAMPPPVQLDTGAVPVLTGLNPVSPVETIDDIMQFAGRHIDQALSAVEMEQLMDGVSRTDPASEPNFDRLAAPLLMRMEWVRDELGHLLYTWLSRGMTHDFFEEKLPDSGHRGGTFWQFQHHRIRAIRARILSGTFQPLLATPTHEGGWLAASVLVERLRALTERGSELDTLDSVQALLRIAPNDRLSAAEGLPDGDNQFLRVLRWALTGAGSAANGDDPDLWLAAWRARHPHKTLEHEGLDCRQFAGPDGKAPAAYSWINGAEKEAIAVAEEEATNRIDKEFEVKLKKAGKSSAAVELMFDPIDQIEEAVPGGGWLHRPLRETFSIDVTPRWIHGGDHVSRPTVLLHAFPTGGPSIRREPFEFEWAAMMWPHNRSALHGAALLYITHAYDRSSSKKWPECACLATLFEPDQPITLPSAMLIGLALFAPQGDLSRTAIDVLVETIADGRAHPDQFAEPLVRLSETKWFQPGRMAANLAEVARVSPLHAWTVAGMLQAVTASWTATPKNAHHLTALLLEILTQLGQPLNPKSATALGGVKASGKSAKLIKQLLALERTDNGAMAPARDAALRARIARASRWSSNGEV